MATESNMIWKDAGFNAPLAIAYGNACVLGNDVYFFGRDQNNAWSQLYKLSGTTVTAITSIPRPRFGMRMFGYGQDLFIFGTGTTAEERVLQRYSLTTRSWTNHLTYTKDLLWSSLCQEGPNVYLTAAGTARNDTEIFSFDLTNVSDIKIKRYAVTNVNRGHMLMGVNNGVVYFGGGFTDVGAFQAFSDFYSLDTATGIQKRLDNMPEVGYFGMTYGSVRGKLIALNPLSGTNATATATHSKKVLSFNYHTEKWHYEQDTSIGINHAACYTLNNQFTRIAGRNTTTYTNACLSLG